MAERVSDYETAEPREETPLQLSPCPVCAGSGQVEGLRAEWIRVGEQMRQDREGRGYTLETEALDRNLPLFLLIQMERGLVRPIVRETLGLLARATPETGAEK